MQLKPEEYLELELSSGRKLRDFQPLNGHYVVLKLEINKITKGGVALPPEYTQRSLRSMVNMLGLVLRATAPYHKKVVRSKEYLWDEKDGRFKVEYDVGETVEPVPGEVEEGQGILYGTYNMGHVTFRDPAVFDEVVIVRECDIEGRFSFEDYGKVALSDFALERTVQGQG